MTIRNKLKESQMRLVELSTYLEVSRPTLYRYLELYEKKDFNGIEKKCFDFFVFIENTRTVTRPLIMDYLINKVLPIESQTNVDTEVLTAVRKLSESRSKIDKKKMQLIKSIASDNVFDDLLDVLLESTKNSDKVTIDTIINNAKKGDK